MSSLSTPVSQILRASLPHSIHCPSLPLLTDRTLTLSFRRRPRSCVNDPSLRYLSPGVGKTSISFPFSAPAFAAPPAFWMSGKCTIHDGIPAPHISTPSPIDPSRNRLPRSFLVEPFSPPVFPWKIAFFMAFSPGRRPSWRSGEPSSAFTCFPLLQMDTGSSRGYFCSCEALDIFAGGKNSARPVIAEEECPSIRVGRPIHRYASSSPSIFPHPGCSRVSESAERLPSPGGRCLCGTDIQHVDAGAASPFRIMTVNPAQLPWNLSPACACARQP